MVQYAFTPWRSRRELLAVRRQFYPEKFDDKDDVVSAAGQRAAVARVSVWMQRGGCPHMVESTALLVAAGLSDGGGEVSMTTTTTTTAASAYAVRATYAAAFGRFVTGLLDGQQDRARKLSMYSLARSVGLPAAFVELRHQATHESLPSLARLRTAARRALSWIWQYYWQRLGGRDTRTSQTALPSASSDPCREAVLRVVDEKPASEEADRAALAPLTQAWGVARVRAVLAAVPVTDEANSTSTPESRARMLRCLRLSGLLLAKDELAQPSQPLQGSAGDLDLDALREKMEKNRQALFKVKGDQNDENGEGSPQDDAVMADAPAPQPETQTPAARPRWTRYEGDWKPKPIGVA